MSGEHSHPEFTDLSDTLAALAGRVTGLENVEIPDVTDLTARVADIESSLAAIVDVLDAIGDTPNPPPPDSNNTIPASYFGMHHVNRTNWPTVDFGSHGKGTIVNWGYVEKTKGTYDWSNLDAWVDTVEAKGYKFIFANSSVPVWASSNQAACRPTFTGGPTVCETGVTDLADWERFMRALVIRYKGRLDYELWNEPDSSFKSPMGDFVKMMNLAHSIIREIDPAAKIGTPCPNSPASDFLDRFFTAGGVKDYDFYSFHGYLNSSRTTPEKRVADIAKVKSIRDKWGLSHLPIWNTEGAWDPSATFTTAQKVAYVARYHLLQWSLGVKRFYWYAWDEPVWGTLWNGSLLPQGLAYQQIYDWMVGAEMTQPCQASGDVWTCELSRPNGYRGLVVWNVAGDSTFTPPPGYQTYRTLEGSRSAVGNTVTIGIKPILLEAS